MISRFFIDRPVFAAVLSIVITLAGAVAAFRLPLAQFPKISPPQVSVNCTYPGASARDVAEAVAAPIEQQVNGVEGMMYMSSSCTNDGGYSLSVTFHQYVDLDMAQVLVQNRVALAIPALPDVLKETGITVRKRSPDPLCGYALVSPGGTHDGLYLSNYTTRFIRDELLRVPGVSDINMIGQRDYSMRIWVNPYRLAARGLTASEVVRAVREQNNEVAAGTIGQSPVPAGQEFQITVDALGRLTEVEQFEQIIVKAMPDGRVVRLKDVARIELGARSEDVERRFNRMDCAFLVIFQQPDANALQTRDTVEAKMQELSQSFPDDLRYEVSFDTTPYTRESIKEVFKTLRDAVILVAVVVLLFLQNWRSALIPLMAVPVAIVGTFAVMAPLDFSLNNLTLFGLVLAIGIVVDDAIVVVEAVEHHIEQGLAPREATIKAMEQVSGPVVAVGLVLSAVFVPCAFISGITGMFFRQFAVTIAVSTLISAFNSLTLSPALAALLLRPQAEAKRTAPLPLLAFPAAAAWLAYEFSHELLGAGGWLLARANERFPDLMSWLHVEGLHDVAVPALVVAAAVLGLLLSWPLNRLLAGFFRLFNAGFGLATTAYTRTTGLLLRGSFVVLLLYVGLLGLTYWQFDRTPKGFIPGQDMGYLLVSVQLPDSASKERTDEVLKQMEDIGLGTPGIIRVTAISGQSFALNAFGSNFGSMFIGLDDYANRRSPALSSEAVAASLRRQFAEKIYDAQAAVFAPPPIRGVGRAGGFTFVVQDRGDLGPVALQEQVDNLARRGNSLLFNPDGTRATPEQVAEADKAVKDAEAELAAAKQSSPGSVREAEARLAEAKQRRPSPRLVGLFSVFRSNVPQLKIEPDPDQCLKRGVQLRDFSDTLRIYQGSAYVNDFNLFGRTWQVIVQSDHMYRDEPTDLKRLKVRNLHGQMVPLGSLAHVREVNGPLVLTRYNMYPAATINGTAAPGFSSRQAIELMQELAEEDLPAAMAYEWTDLSYLELKAGSTAYVLFAFAVAMVFLVLAGQYESWAMPLAVILVVPMCLLSSVVGVSLAGMDINIFTQIGFVVLVGLASKNAVLIVEFARTLRAQGMTRREATLEACRLRLRPIVMTSLAFILGVVPLILSYGAGMEMRRTLGVAVFSGMVGVTLFGLVLTPVFFATIDWLGGLPVFARGWVRRVSDVALDVLTLRSVRRLATRVVLRTAPGRPREPSGAVPAESPARLAGPTTQTGKPDTRIQTDIHGRKAGGS